jgi:integrase
MVVDANGQISGLIELADSAAKKCSGRSIPIHPDLAAALRAWRQIAKPSDYVITSERGGRMRPLSIVVWFNRAFKNIGLKGCSSHSGRRTFVTRGCSDRPQSRRLAAGRAIAGGPPIDPDQPFV